MARKASEREAAVQAAASVASLARPLDPVSSLFGAGKKSDTEPKLNTVSDAIGDSQKHLADLLKSLADSAEKARDAKSAEVAKDEKRRSDGGATADGTTKSETSASLRMVFAAYGENDADNAKAPSSTKSNAYFDTEAA